MGKQKNEKAATDLDGNDPAGAAGGAENTATAGTTGAVPEKPADAVSDAAPPAGDQPAVDAAATDTGAAVAGAAVAAGSEEAEKEIGNGEAAQTPGDDDLDEKFGVAELARGCSGGGLVFANGRIPITLAQVFSVEEATIMAEFVRENPEAPLLAMYKHLELTKRLAPTVPNNADMLALSLFRHACLAAFEYERCESAEKAAAEFEATPAASWGGATALDPIQPAMQPTGFSPR